MPYDINSLKNACSATDSNSEKVAYSTDASTIKGEALSICWPSNVDELQKLMRVATRERIPLTIRGSGTSLVGGAVPQNSLVIDLSKMNKIKVLDVGEKFAVVEAGVVLDELNNALAASNLEFPIQPGSHAAATIGGMIATDAAGMLSKKFGRIENWILGMMIMDGTGKIFNLGQVESKEFIGTEGCCVIVLNAKLKLIPKLQGFSSDLFEFKNTLEMLGKLNELENDVEVIAIEYINRFAAKLSGMKDKEYLLVKYSSPKGALKYVDKEYEHLWKLRENMYSVLVEKGYERIEDPQISREGMPKFFEWLNQIQAPAYGHISEGIIHPHFKRNQPEIDLMYEKLKDFGGKPAAEHGIGILKRKYAPFAFTQKIKQLKEKYDPYNILNKGKVI